MAGDDEHGIHSIGVARLAGSLVAISLAACSGPLDLAKTTVAEVATLAQVHIDSRAELRELHRSITSAVNAWADGQGIDPDAVQQGLALAAALVAESGLTHEDMAGMFFDTDRISDEAVSRAARTDPRYWGSEDHYAVAERALRETYATLVKRLRADEPVLVPVVRALGPALERRLAGLEIRVERVEETLVGLTHALLGAATATEVLHYLKTRLVDWDQSPWRTNRTAPSVLERRLRVRHAAGEPVKEPGGFQVESESVVRGPVDPDSPGPPRVRFTLDDRVVMSAEDLLDGDAFIAVLGGPGTGKSWLARRLAREVARRAVSALESGARVCDVELPVLTTWSAWASRSGETKPALISSSFDSGAGLDDLSTGGVSDRVQRTLRESGARVFLFVDSLDESSDVTAQDSRLRELDRLEGWRVLVTSRPSAWQVTGGVIRTDRHHVVAELLPLSYPAEVESFIDVWFADDPPRAAALAQHVRGNAHLRQVAPIPLLLTFFCLIAEAASSPSVPLPQRRHEIFEALIRRLLLQAWGDRRVRANVPKHVASCNDLLRAWAWSALAEQSSASHVVTWSGTFREPVDPSPSPTQARAVAAVAPVVHEDDEGGVLRTFLHHTLFEHLLAEHIGRVGEEQAMQVLLTGSFWSSAWGSAGPAAIAAHNREHRGDLLQRFLDWAASNPASYYPEQAQQAVDLVLLAVAEESSPGEWRVEQQTALNAARVRTARTSPGRILSSAQWASSNTPVREVALRALERGDGVQVVALLSAVASLSPTPEERTRARQALLFRLRYVSPHAAFDLVASEEHSLDPVGSGPWASRTASRVLSDPQSSVCLKAYSSLVPPHLDDGVAHDEILHAFRMVNPGSLVALTLLLRSVRPSGTAARRARLLIVEAMSRAYPSDLPPLVASLLTLGPDAADRGRARTAVAQALTSKEPGPVMDLVETYMSLGPRTHEVQASREAVLGLLRRVEAPRVASIVEALLRLGLDEADREGAVTAVVEKLQAAERRQYGELAKSYFSLVRTEEEATRGRACLLDHLDRGEPGAVAGVATVLALSSPPAPEQFRARRSLLRLAEDAAPWQLKDVVDALHALGAESSDIGELRTSLVRALPEAYHWDMSPLVRLLLTLGPAPEELSVVRRAIAGSLIAADESSRRDLVAAFDATEPSDEQREVVCARLLRWSESATRIETHHAVTALFALRPSARVRREARLKLLARVKGSAHGPAARLLEDYVLLVAASEVAGVEAEVASVLGGEPREGGLVDAIQGIVDARFRRRL